MNRRLLSMMFMVSLLGSVLSAYGQKSILASGAVGSLQLDEVQVNKIKSIQDQLLLELNRQSDGPMKGNELASLKQDFYNQLKSSLSPSQLQVMSNLKKKVKITKADRLALRKYHQTTRLQIAQYHYDHIWDQQHAQREKLEQYIDEQDQIILDQLRAKMAWANNENDGREDVYLKNFIVDGKVRKGPKYVYAVRRGQVLLNQEDHQQLEDIASKYAKEIDLVLAEIRPIHNDWITDQNQIRSQNKPNNYDKLMDRGTDVLAIAFDEVYNKRLSNIARFIFWDPNPGTPGQTSYELQDLAIQLSPNPARSEQQIKFEVNQRGQVDIAIFDLNGRLVQQVFNGELNSGSQQFNVSMDDLQANNYYYRITTANRTQTIPVTIL